MCLGRDDYAYSRLLERLWRERETFLLIEHDVELTTEALQTAIDCDCLWSVAPYRGQGQTHKQSGLFVQSLGCVRFRSELMEAAPGAIAEANGARDAAWAICPPGHWKALDGRVMHALSMEGFAPHQHEEVPHHHVYDYGCACGGDHG